MKSTTARKDRPLDGVNGTIEGKGTQLAVVCEACLKPLPPGSRKTKHFCSSDCRLLSWAVDALIKALKEGKAEGLRGKVSAIAGGLKVEVVHTWDGRQPS